MTRRRDADENTRKQRRVIDRELARGLADVRLGRIQGPFANVEEFMASLHWEVAKLGAKKPRHPAR